MSSDFPRDLRALLGGLRLCEALSRLGMQSKVHIVELHPQTPMTISMQCSGSQLAMSYDLHT